MKRFFVPMILCFGILMLMQSEWALAASVKIGLIDTQKIMRESKSAKKARSVFLKDLEAKRVVLRTRQEEVRAMQLELRREGTNMSPSLRQEKADRLAKEVKELRRLRSDLEEELKKKEMELTRRLLIEIREVVRKFRRDKKYTVILEKNSVIASDETIDITDNIIQLYDNSKK